MLLGNNEEIQKGRNSERNKKIFIISEIIALIPLVLLFISGLYAFYEVFAHKISTTEPLMVEIIGFVFIFLSVPAFFRIINLVLILKSKKNDSKFIRSSPLWGNLYSIVTIRSLGMLFESLTLCNLFGLFVSRACAESYFGQISFEAVVVILAIISLINWLKYKRSVTEGLNGN